MSEDVLFWIMSIAMVLSYVIGVCTGRLWEINRRYK